MSETKRRPRLVLDTNVVASAILWGGKPREFLTLLRCGRVSVFSSAPMLAELAEVLERPKFQAKIRASFLTADQLVEAYAALAVIVKPVTVKGVVPDADDDVVVGTAMAAQADIIVTGDKVFLSLASHDGIRIMSVMDALSWIND